MALTTIRPFEWPPDSAHLPLFVALFSLGLLAGSYIILPCLLSNTSRQLQGFFRFFYASFVKPHSGDDDGSQQGALESFYKAQVSDRREHKLIPRR